MSSKNLLTTVTVRKGPLLKPVDVYNEPDITQAKAHRAVEVKTASVVISTGKEFDADENAQTRMMRALKVAEITGETTVNWKLVDNTFTSVTITELEEAFVLAAKKQLEIWEKYN